MMRMTTYEAERLERMLESWVRSMLGPASSDVATSRTWQDRAEGRSEEYRCRVPILHADAERIDELVDGRPASQLRAAIPRMPEIWRATLRMVYLDQWTQRQIAKRLQISPPAVCGRLKQAKLYLADALFRKGDSAGSRASA